MSAYIYGSEMFWVLGYSFCLGHKPLFNTFGYFVQLLTKLTNNHTQQRTNVTMALMNNLIWITNKTNNWVITVLNLAYKIRYCLFHSFLCVKEQLFQTFHLQVTIQFSDVVQNFAKEQATVLQHVIKWIQ